MSDQGRASVLVVDDEPFVREMVRDFLAVLGLEADGAANAAEGLARIEEGQYELLVTDYLMPGMNGLDLAAKVRAEHPEIDVVLLTGSVLPDLVDRIRGTGFEVLNKPFRFDAFKELIERKVSATP
jgi:CheY-like chemotaxis protein